MSTGNRVFRIAVTTLAIGGAFGVLDRFFSDDAGAGKEVVACTTGYEGLVRVTDSAVLGELGEIAARYGNIFDYEAERVSKDKALDPGELACKSLLNNGVVLNLAGLEALQRSPDFNPQSLPDGLEYATDTPG